MNGSSISKAVCRKLHSEYPNVTIYREHIVEGFIRPCFFVYTSNVTHGDEMHERFHQLYTIEVNYFPSRGNESAYCEIADLQGYLPILLNSIEVEIGDYKMPVWGSEKKSPAVDDDMLQMSITYRIEGFVMKNKAVPMKDLSIIADGE